MFYKRNLILFTLFFFIVAPCTSMETQPKNEKNKAHNGESLFKKAGKSFGGYFLGLCASALTLTAFSTFNSKHHSDAYIATALLTSFGCGCTTNFLVHQYPKRTLTAIGIITLAMAGITTCAYFS